MRISVFKILGLVFLWCTFLAPQVSNAQSEKEFSKELEQANLSVYQDAEKAVELSAFVYKNAKLIDTKIMALVTLVNAYTTLNKNGEALKFANKTLQLAERSGNDQYQIWALGLLGEQYQLTHLNSISREYLDRAAVLVQNSDLSKEAIAVSQGNIFAIKGNGYKDEIDCDFAIKNYDLAIQAYKSIAENSVARNNLALVYLEKGNCLLELGNLVQAEKNFYRVLDIASPNNLEEYTQNATLGLAKIDARNGKLESSNQTAEQLLNTIDTLQHPKLKNELYYLLKENYLALENLQMFQFYGLKFETSSQDIAELEKDQFREVLQFVATSSQVPSNRFSPGKTFLFVLLILATAIIFWEVYRVINPRKRL